MNLSTFKSKAEKFNDFYVFYSTPRGNYFSAATLDLDTPYIKEHRRARKPSNIKPTEVILWSWTQDRYMVLDSADIRSVTPLKCNG